MESLAESQAQRVALGIEYCGTGYHGWQRQSHSHAVQNVLEAALSQVANHPVEVVCAGRTDTGVHATGQVVHFDTSARRALKAWVLGVNSNMPRDVRVRWAREVPDQFHARFSARWRRYRYVVQNTAQPGAIQAGLATWQRTPLDAGLMHTAAQYLLGEQDFSAFRAANCQSHSSCRNMMHFSVQRRGHYVMFDIKANAFLYHMVRNLVGTLFLVGNGTRPPEWIAEILSGRDRRQAGDTAPADGLYLVDVGYPDEFELPQEPVQGPLWWGGD